MSIWDSYKARVAASGTSSRDIMKNRELHMLNKKIKETLSAHPVVIDGVAREAAIINCDNLDEKLIYSMESDAIYEGSVVEWMNNFWLVIERDANSEIYTKAKLQQCNHLLKWISPDGVIHEQWCFVADGTKYLIGEYEDRNFVVTRGDSRISILISRNEHTAKLGREHRFLIDDNDNDEKLAYALTKPLKIGNIHNNHGVYSFVLHETASTEFDNHELGIADYYKYFPKESASDTPEENGATTPDDTQGKKVWI